MCAILISGQPRIVRDLATVYGVSGTTEEARYFESTR
jgi:hypothetical protein